MPTAQYTVHICKSSDVHSIQPPELDELENLYSPSFGDCMFAGCMFACLLHVFSDGQENIINLCEIVLGLGALTRRLGALTRRLGALTCRLGTLTRALMRQALVADCLTPSWLKLCWYTNGTLMVH